MSGEIAPRKIGRGYERNLDAGPFQPMVSSFDLHLRAEKKSPKTIRTYPEAAPAAAVDHLMVLSAPVIMHRRRQRRLPRRGTDPQGAGPEDLGRDALAQAGRDQRAHGRSGGLRAVDGQAVPADSDEDDRRAMRIQEDE